MTTDTLHASLDQIRAKVHAGQRLSAHDGHFLFSPEADLHGVGELADMACRRRHGNVVYYNINAHLNPTNVCIYQCPLCAYHRDPDDPAAYVMTDQEILAHGQEAVDAGCTELHIVGGVHPAKSFGWYVSIIRQLHQAYPRLHLKAFTAIEIDWFSRIARRPVPAVLEELMADGLGSLPGGARKSSIPRFAGKSARASPRSNVARHPSRRTPTRPAFQRHDALRPRGRARTSRRSSAALAELQDETEGFQAFIPLSFHPENTQMAYLPKVSGLVDLRTVAVSRLMLDNFDHIKAYWVSLGVGTAQAALAYGADDLDGTVRHERIHHDAGRSRPRSSRWMSCGP